MPSGESRPEGTVSFTFNNNDIWKFGTLTISPFNWLEASYFYYRPSDLTWEGDGVRGHYLDKGFNVKFVYRPEILFSPSFAIGLDDFAGTGFFSREYMVSTINFNKFKGTLGVGWGKLASENSFENPFAFVSDKLLYRPPNFETGTPSFNQWFRGDASIFGGFEYSLLKNRGVKLKVEYDPFDYKDFSANNRDDALIDLRKKDSNLNIGISYPVNKYMTLDASFVKGNTFNLSFNFSIPFKDQLQEKKEFMPNVSKKSQDNTKLDFYDDLLYNLNKNNLFLQTANLDENQKLNISISTSDHRNSIRSSSFSSQIAYEVASLNKIKLSQINVSQINAGIELNQIEYIAQYYKNQNIPTELIKRNTKFYPGDSSKYQKHEYRPKILFPLFFTDVSPALVSHIGNPEKFFFGGFDLNLTSEIQFSRNLLLSSTFNLPIYGEFENTISGPGSLMEHVRTDLVQYLKEDDIHITRLQLDYVWSPIKNIYARFSGGIFEEMYGGIGFETLYKPFHKNFYVGAEIFNVRKRSFDQRLNFDDYKTVTGHVNIGYIFNKGVEANLSFGRYLAKDDGYTFDISRRLKSGFKTGVYFTRTNVSKELFGEGSFDKGFYFQIPLDIFSNQYVGNYSTFKISPLTRDGGAKLIFDKDLRGLIYNSTLYELQRQWAGFNR